jgi:iron(III) transport system substrate-binding protein
MSDFTLSRGAAIAGGAASLVAMTSPVFAANDPMPALIAAAKTEGAITVDGPPIDSVREGLTKGFQAAYGIPVSYISSGSSASGARVRAERAAGKYLLDVLVSGIDTPTLTFLPSGWLDKVEPVLVAPDVLDKKRWKDGHLWFEDGSNTILRVLQFVQSEIAINTKLVKKGEIPTWKSLLDPKWQGKIIVKDPTISGAGASLISYFYLQYGADYVKRLYRDQKPIVSRDARQSVQWLAEGNYPILVGPESTFIFQFQKLGYPILPLFPSDGPSVLTGGWGLISLLNKAPHPNAAKLFINWIAGQKGGEIYANANASVSLRTDVKYDALVPPFSFPQKGVKYIDTYEYKFVTEQRGPAFEKAREVLGE